MESECIEMNQSLVDPKLETRKECVKFVTEWIIENCRPLKIIEDSGLEKLGNFLLHVGSNEGAKVNIKKLYPQPTTLSRNIGKVYGKYFCSIKDEIIQYKSYGYAITCDIWTDGYLKTSYLCCNMHYIKGGALMERLLAIKPMKENTCSATSNREKIEQILRTFGCDLELDKPAIVIDSGSNMMKAFRDLNEIHCANHLLNNVVEKAIETVPKIRKIVTICSKLVKYLKKSEMNSTLAASLKSFCPTRWNTAYYLMKSIKIHWIDISVILKKNDETHRVQDIDFSNLCAVVQLLACFERVSKALEKSKHPTIQLVVPNIDYLVASCQAQCVDNDIIKDLKLALQSEIENIIRPNLTKYHNIALFLFPPANKLVQFSPTEREIIINECKEIMLDFVMSNASKTPESSAPPEQSNDLDDYNPMARHAVWDYHCTTTNSDRVDEEVTDYVSRKVRLTNDFDVLAWWKDNKETFPMLHKTFCKILCIPASSAASERTFANARNLITEKRSPIAHNSNKASQVMFLHSNISKIELNLNLN